VREEPLLVKRKDEDIAKEKRREKQQRDDEDRHRYRRRRDREDRTDNYKNEEEQKKREDQVREQERLDRLRQEEFEARERRNAEARKKAEEERQVREQLARQRKERLGNAFAINGDDDDDNDREANLLRKERRIAIPRTSQTSSQASGASSGAAAGGTGTSPIQIAVGRDLAVPTAAPRLRSDPLGEDLGTKLGFSENNMDPATAFMRLQERKRKGRRPEFGGPPRGCSPWRDGKRGVITPLMLARINQQRTTSRSRSPARDRDARD